MGARIRRIGVLALLLAWMPTAWSTSVAVTEAQALVNQGQYQEALAKLDRHIKSAPQDAEARFTRGLVLVRLDRNDEAIEAFSSLTKDYPQLPEPYNNLAVIYAQQGDYEKARDALEDALGTHPSYGVAHENLGDIYAALAAAAYNRALTLDQNNPSVRAKLNLINQLDSLGDNRPTEVAQAPPAAPKPPPAAAKPEPPAPTPPPAKTETPAPAAPPKLDGVALGKFVAAWEAAWESRDPERYLSHYSPDFEPIGMSLSDWKAQRRDRVSRPKSISVEVSDIQFEDMGGGKVVATFRQEYQSDTFSNRATKVLELTSSGDGWKIIREYTR